MEKLGIKGKNEDRNITPFSQEHQDQDDPLFSDLEAVEGRISAGGKGLSARLVSPILNVFEQTAFSIPDKGMELIVRHAKVITVWIGTGVALCGDLLGATAGAFALGVGGKRSFGWKHRQFAFGHALWTVVGGSGFPSSSENTLRFLAKFSHNYSVGQPKCKQ